MAYCKDAARQPFFGRPGQTISECKDAARQPFFGHRRGAGKAPGCARASPLLDGTNAYGDYELTPGEHTLQLIVGDHHHMPLSPSVTSEQITITVE